MYKFDKKIEYPILFFDGVCNLCDSSVKFIINNDSQGRIKIAPLQSNLAEMVLPEKPKFDSLVLFENGKVYYKSAAALRIALKLDGLWKVLGVFLIIPYPIRDLVYDFIAQNRYRWFGKKDECMLPTPEVKSRFLV
jgi:predicted DCC family thiol-disulfide oxidoreductase YuxK